MSSQWFLLTICYLNVVAGIISSASSYLHSWYQTEVVYGPIEIEGVYYNRMQTITILN